MKNLATSRSGSAIRLTAERWSHIAAEHAEMTSLRDEVLKTISNAERVYSGNLGELLALRELERGKWIVVVYRESGEDGFVITSFLTRRLRSLERRRLVWPPN